MANSELRKGESYEEGTREKYRDRAVATTYDSEFNAPKSLNDWFVRWVSRGEKNAVARLLASLPENATIVADLPCGDCDRGARAFRLDSFHDLGS